MDKKVTALLMPKWGMDMAEGTVMNWLVEEGDQIYSGDELLEVESEKTISAIEAVNDGVLWKKLVQQGDIRSVGALLGVIADKDTPSLVVDEFISRFTENQPGSQSTDTNNPSSHDEIINILDQEILYRSSGHGDQSILFVHGFGGNLKNWALVQKKLSARFHTVSFDLPGHGGSTKSMGSVEADFFVNVIHKLLDELDIRSAHLVGHSWGGELVLRMAEFDASRVNSVTQIGIAMHNTPDSPDFLADFIEASRRTEIKTVLKRLFFNPDVISRDMVEEVLNYKRLDGVEKTLRQISQLYAVPNEASLLQPKPNVPIQIVFGKEDKIASPNVNLLTDSKLGLKLIDNVGHMPHLEAPLEVAHLIEEFIISHSE